MVTRAGLRVRVEEHHIDIADRCRVEAAVAMSPDKIAKDAGADPRIGQPAGRDDVQGAYEPWFGPNMPDKCVDIVRVQVRAACRHR
jgi:hypothetical protein